MKSPVWAMALTPSFVAAIVIAAACSQGSSNPPYVLATVEAGGGGNGASGGGGNGGSTACGKQGGQCLAAGDMVGCPQPVAGNLCDDPENEAATTGRFCCLGLNDAGPPNDATE